MNRFPPVKIDEWLPEQRAVADAITAGPRGQLRGPFIPLIYSPGLAECVQKLGEYLRFKNRLPDDLVELAILLTARRNRCANIWQSHRTLALKAGLDPSIIAAIAREQRPPSLSEKETAIYDFVIQLTRDIGVDDAVFDRVVTMWGRPTTMDLIGVCGYYVMLAMVLNTAQVLPPDQVRPFDP